MQEDLDIVVPMETKRSSFCQRRIGSIWRSRRVECESLFNWFLGGPSDDVEVLFSCGPRSD